MVTSAISNPPNSGYTPVHTSTSNAAYAAIPTTNPAGRNEVAVMNPLLPGGLLGLTLANGMTAGAGDIGGDYSNPPAHPGTYGGKPGYSNKTGLPGQPKRIGVMRNPPGLFKAQYSLYFIFNPNEIDVSFNTSSTNVPATYTYGIQDGTSSSLDAMVVPNIVNSQTVTWSLLFDRTYDMLYGDQGTTGGGGKSRGVLSDVAALYNLMGSFEGASGTPLSVPIEVAFAQETSGQLWGFTGFITYVGITYGVFRYDMIPSRAEVQITMTATYLSPTVPPPNLPTYNAKGQYTGGINAQGGTATAQHPEGPPAPPGPNDVSPSGLPGTNNTSPSGLPGTSGAPVKQTVFPKQGVKNPGVNLKNGVTGPLSTHGWS